MEPQSLEEFWNWILQVSPVSLSGFEETALDEPELCEPVSPTS